MNRTLKAGLSVVLMAPLLLLLGGADVFAKGGHGKSGGKGGGSHPSGFDQGNKKGWDGGDSPRGWDQGEKSGWDDDKPPGLDKKEDKEKDHDKD